MAIANQVDSIDQVEESIRGAYVEVEGKFHLDADKYADLKAQGLKKKNKELLDKVRGSQTADERIAALESELRSFKLTTPLRALALKAGVMPDRLDFAMTDMQRHFTLDEFGRIVALDEYGEPMDISPERYLENQYKNKHPFLYAASQTGGSGAHNGNRGAISSQVMTREAFERMSQQERMAFSMKGGEIRD